MSSEEYKESDLSKIVKRLMDEEGFEFGEAVREAMEQTKNFESKADGGSVGIEILFGPKVPAAPSQLVEESEIVLGYRGPGGYQSGSSSSSSTNQGPAGGASAGGNYGGNRNPSQTYGGSVFSGGGGNQNAKPPKTKTKTKTPNLVDNLKNVYGIVSPFVNPTSNLGKVKTLFDTYNLYKNGPFTKDDMILGMGDNPLPSENLLAFKPGSKKDNKLKSLFKEKGLTEDLGIPFSPKKDKQLQELMKEDQEQTDFPKTQLLKAADGGRVGYVSGGAALKLLEKGKEGIASLYNAGKSIFSKGDDVVDIAKQEEIFRSGNITTDFLENVDDKVIKKFVATRDAKGPGGYGLYDSFDDMPNGLKAAELISRIKNAEGGINYEAAELFIGKKLKGNETVDELISMVVTEKMAEGGRVGLFMGGDPLDGQALSIYNSMNAYGFDDQAIADALSEQGLYTAPGNGTPDAPDTTPGQTYGLQSGSDNFSPYNPDPNKIQSFKTDPRITAANEADVRTKQLTSMGINDPFANEASLSGAYYGDMPTDTSNQIGTQSMFAKAKQGLTGLMDNPLVNLISSSTPFGMLKNVAKGIGSKMPVNQRAIQENVMGNLGFAVNDIGQIVSTGDYNDPNNVMAGYNLNRMTVDTFKNRIDKIRNRKIAQTAASRARIAAIEEAQRKFELGEKLKADALLEAQLKKAQQEIDAKGYQDYGQGAASQATQDSYAGSDGSYAGASTQDYGDGEKDGGIIGYRKGGLATMFTRRR